MWLNKEPSNSTPRGFPFSTPQPEKKRSCPSNAYSSPPYGNRQRPIPLSEKKWTSLQSKTSNNLFHVIHKLPAGDSPYVRAKHVQLVDNNPSKAVSLFWAAINSGDRVDSALKDMAVVMKQLNRSDEAIEAIKSFRHLCPADSQESLDNILLELYKRSGRVEDQIELLESKLKHMEENTSIDGNQTKIARSQGKKIQITVGQEYSRLLGNLAWAYLQQDCYKTAEEIYRKALSLEPDKNKRCNLAICLMYMNKMTEAKFLLSTVKESTRNRTRDTEEESYAKSYERAMLVMEEFQMEDRCHTGNHLSFSSFLTRNKETDPADKVSKQRSGSDPGFKRSNVCSSPVNIPFTQPRRREWERVGAGGGCFRKLQYEKPAGIKMEALEKCEMSDVPLGESTPRTLFTQPRRAEWESVDTGGGCLGGSYFQKPGDVKVERSAKCEMTKIPLGEERTGKKSWADIVSGTTQAPFSQPRRREWEPVDTVERSGKCEMTEMPLGEERTRKKSWADMVEEEEQSCYGDENEDCNLMNGESECFRTQDGYETQPGTATCHRNQMVKRCLTFERGQSGNEDENYLCSSPL